MCGSCGGSSSGQPAESYVVTRANGTTVEVDTQVQAKVELTKSGGTITVAKKK